MNLNRRLYCFTGKGGTGKTALAHSFAAYLSKNNSKVEFINFGLNRFESSSEKSSMADHSTSKFEQLDYTYTQLTLLESCKVYVDQKLKSSTVSNWIVSTKFFQSLVLLTPGLSYLIFMGHIISKLRKDPEKIIIFDSPASGHFLTLFQSIWNFHRVFRKGMLFKDTDQIVRFLKDDRNLSVLIVTLPNSVSFQESSELAKELNENFEMNSELIFNNCLSLVYQDSKEDIASTFLKHKLEFEYAIESKLPENTLKIPLVLETDRESIIKSIESYLEKMYND